MKKAGIYKTLSFILLFVIISGSSVTAQGPPPPPPPDHGSNSNVPGGGAPIGSGLLLLVALGAGYGAKKLYARRKKLAE